MNEGTYPVHELFASFQGEGVFMGCSAFFVRLYGCPVKCPFCDSAGTWHPNWVPKDVQRLTPEQIVGEMRRNSIPEFAVITGGEPTIFDLMELSLALGQIPVHLETSGAFAINGLFQWITLSPKKWKLPLPENIRLANEFKLIVEKPEDILYYTEMMQSLVNDFEITAPIWLHPEWSQRNNQAVKTAIIDAVKNGNGRYRAGWQLHKMYQADSLDFRSRPLAPLGGNPQKGY